jgi:hypothetical protein
MSCIVVESRGVLAAVQRRYSPDYVDFCAPSGRQSSALLASLHIYFPLNRRATASQKLAGQKPNTIANAANRAQ